MLTSPSLEIFVKVPTLSGLVKGADCRHRVLRIGSKGIASGISPLSEPRPRPLTSITNNEFLTLQIGGFNVRDPAWHVCGVV